MPVTDKQCQVQPEYFRLMCDKLSCGAMILDEELKVVYINDWLLNLLPFNASEVLNHNLPQLIPQLLETRFVDAVKEAFRARTSTRLSASFAPNILALKEPITKQPMVHSTTISLIGEADNSLCFVNIHDETKPYKREQLLQEYIAKLKNTERLLESARDEAIDANEAKNIFLSNMSHQLKTPLNAIVGFAQLLAESDNGTFNEIQMDCISQIQESGTNLNRFTQQVLLLMATQSEQIPSEECCLKQEMAHLVEAYKQRGKEHSVDIHYQPAESVFSVETNNSKLCAGLLRNLFDIALACQMPGAVLNISVNPSFGRQYEVLFSGEFLRIPLIDEGPKKGIRQEENPYPNTDLDITFLLALSNKAAEKLDANLHFDHKKGLKLEL